MESVWDKFIDSFGLSTAEDVARYTRRTETPGSKFRATKLIRESSKQLGVPQINTNVIVRHLQSEIIGRKGAVDRYVWSVRFETSGADTPRHSTFASLDSQELGSFCSQLEEALAVMQKVRSGEFSGSFRQRIHCRQQNRIGNEPIVEVIVDSGNTQLSFSLPSPTGYLRGETLDESQVEMALASLRGAAVIAAELILDLEAADRLTYS